MPIYYSLKILIHTLSHVCFMLNTLYKIYTLKSSQLMWAILTIPAANCDYQIHNANIFSSQPILLMFRSYPFPHPQALLCLASSYFSSLCARSLQNWYLFLGCVKIIHSPIFFWHGPVPFFGLKSSLQIPSDTSTSNIIASAELAQEPFLPSITVSFDPWCSYIKHHINLTFCFLCLFQDYLSQ